MLVYSYENLSALTLRHVNTAAVWRRVWSMNGLTEPSSGHTLVHITCVLTHEGFWSIMRHQLRKYWQCWILISGICFTCHRKDRAGGQTAVSFSSSECFRSFAVFVHCYHCHPVPAKKKKKKVPITPTPNSGYRRRFSRWRATFIHRKQWRPKLTNLLKILTLTNSSRHKHNSKWMLMLLCVYWMCQLSTVS